LGQIVWGAEGEVLELLCCCNERVTDGRMRREGRQFAVRLDGAWAW